MSTLVIINTDQMGHGDRELGQRLIKTFFSKVGQIQDLETIAFYNAGVKLLVPESPAIETLAMVDQQGVDLIACGTCCDHFEIREMISVADVVGMEDIVAAMGKASRVITL